MLHDIGKIVIHAGILLQTIFGTFTSTYNLKSYVQHNCLNSQVAEQRNATNKTLRSSVSYMDFENTNVHFSCGYDHV